MAKYALLVLLATGCGVSRHPNLVCLVHPKPYMFHNPNLRMRDCNLSYQRCPALDRKILTLSARTSRLSGHSSREYESCPCSIYRLPNLYDVRGIDHLWPLLWLTHSLT